MDFALIFLAVAIVFIGEKTGFRVINFGAFMIMLYLGFNTGDAWLIGIFTFIGIAIMAHSVFGSS